MTANRPPLVQPFVGNSSMDALLRELDWSDSPIGTPGNWPGTWRAALRMCLDSFVPMVVLLGEDFRMIYNDACVPVVGGRHPRCLGKSAAAEWPEIWPAIIEPMVKHVQETGEPAGSDDLYLPLERNGYPEETHMAFAVSAIREDDGKPTALLVTLRETTERVLVARLVECLDALSTRCFPADTAEEACLIAAGVTSGYLRDLPFTLMYLVEADGQHARLVASSGFADQPADIAPTEVALTADEAVGPWNIAQAVRTQASAESQGMRERVASHLRDPQFAPHVVITLPLADPSGGVAGVLVMGTNPMRPALEGLRLANAVASRITTAIANAKVKQRTRERAEALAKLDRAKTLFLSDVSHEFRTPLTLLMSPLDDVLNGHTLAATDRELLQTSRRAGTRLLKLVQSLLDFSRVEAGRVQAAFEAVDLGTLTADLASLFRSTFERAKVGLVVECAPLPEAVHVDRDMWEKIVLNLLSNAIKFTLVGEVSIRLALEEQWVTLAVRDTGCGISPDDLPHVFERFHRGSTTHARTAEGSGIGLSLVQELVRLHGGNVSVVSEVDKGTTVTVRVRRGTEHLPTQPVAVSRRQNVTAGAAPYIEEVSGWVADSDAPAPQADAPGAQGTQKVVSAAPPESDERILVVDDNADMRRYLRHILQERWKVETATDGMTALARIRQSPPDLVIADLMMPGLDGLALVGALRDDPRFAETPVMVLSARANEDASIDALNAGADDYLPKPFSARELTARVAVQLARLRLRRAERAAREVAEQSSSMKEELMLMLSSSLRSPLNAMLSTLALLKDHAFGSEEARRALDLIRASSREQHRLLDEVHDVSCITAGCFHVAKGRVSSLSQIVSAEVDALRSLATARRVRVESFVDSGAGPLEADAERLHQLVQNLLAHAVACTPSGGNVIVECRGRKDHVELVVRDNGIGIAAESIPHVFDAAWQMRRVRADGARTGGVWLGLAVVHQIVQLHGGRIAVSSGGPGMGAVFSVGLPLMAVARSDSPAHGAGKIPASPRAAGRIGAR